MQILRKICFLWVYNSILLLWHVTTWCSPFRISILSFFFHLPIASFVFNVLNYSNLSSPPPLFSLYLSLYDSSLQYMTIAHITYDNWQITYDNFYAVYVPQPRCYFYSYHSHQISFLSYPCRFFLILSIHLNHYYPQPYFKTVSKYHSSFFLIVYDSQP